MKTTNVSPRDSDWRSKAKLRTQVTSLSLEPNVDRFSPAMQFMQHCRTAVKALKANLPLFTYFQCMFHCIMYLIFTPIGTLTVDRVGNSLRWCGCQQKPRLTLSFSTHQETWPSPTAVTKTMPPEATCKIQIISLILRLTLYYI